MAVMVGERGKASATAVPTPTREVAEMAAAAPYEGRAVELGQPDRLQPAASARAASSPTVRASPPIARPIFMGRL